MGTKFIKGFILAAFLGASVAACGQTPAATTVADDPSPVATLPSDVQFSMSALDALVPPDATKQLSSMGGINVSILSDMHQLSCSSLGEWLGKSIPALPGYTATCGVVSPTGDVPERHGKVIPGTEDPLEYSVQIEYAPAGLDLATTTASAAFEQGLIDVALHYNTNSWNGQGFPTISTKSNPTDRTSGGYVYGKIDGLDAVVQLGAKGTRLQTTATIDGDTFAVVENGQIEPETAITLASKLNFSSAG